jgi:CRP/FNR family transcriptional regulator, nitrogen fixation regulation protein
MVAGMLAWPMDRRDIADYLGLTLETVSWVLWFLQDGGVLALSGARQIARRDRRRLAAVNR